MTEDPTTKAARRTVKREPHHEIAQAVQQAVVVRGPHCHAELALARPSQGSRETYRQVVQQMLVARQGPMSPLHELLGLEPVADRLSGRRPPRCR